jgi:hypothetical protein
MFVIVIILATIMALFAVIGYLAGGRASVFTSLVVVLGLLLIARAGGTLAQLINGLYFGIRFVLGGGVQALGAGGDRAAAIDRIIQSISDPQLVDPNSPGPELILFLLILVALSLLLTRVQRFRLRGPSSGWGLLWGLVSGYLLGAYLLVKLQPGAAAFLPLPFGLGQAAPAASALPASGPGLLENLTRSVLAADTNTLALIVMALIATFIVFAVLFGNRSAGSAGGAGGAGRSRRNGPG